MSYKTSENAWTPESLWLAEQGKAFEKLIQKS